MSNSIDRHEPQRLSDESRSAIREQRETSRVLDAITTRSTSWEALEFRYAQVKHLRSTVQTIITELELRAAALSNAHHGIQAEFCRAWARVLREACQ